MPAKRARRCQCRLCCHDGARVRRPLRYVGLGFQRECARAHACACEWELRLLTRWTLHARFTQNDSTPRGTQLTRCAHSCSVVVSRQYNRGCGKEHSANGRLDLRATARAVALEPPRGYARCVPEQPCSDRRVRVCRPCHSSSTSPNVAEAAIATAPCRLRARPAPSRRLRVRGTPFDQQKYFARKCKGACIAVGCCKRCSE